MTSLYWETREKRGAPVNSLKTYLGQDTISIHVELSRARIVRRSYEPSLDTSPLRYFGRMVECAKDWIALRVLEEKELWKGDEEVWGKREMRVSSFPEWHFVNQGNCRKSETFHFLLYHNCFEYSFDFFSGCLKYSEWK